MEYTMPVRTAVNTRVAKVWVGADLCHTSGSKHNSRSLTDWMARQCYLYGHKYFSACTLWVEGAIANPGAGGGAHVCKGVSTTGLIQTRARA